MPLEFLQMNHTSECVPFNLRRYIAVLQCIKAEVCVQGGQEPTICAPTPVLQIELQFPAYVITGCIRKRFQADSNVKKDTRHNNNI